MRRFLISLGVLALTAASGAAYASVSASAASAAPTCTPNVNGQWTGAFNAGTVSGGAMSDAATMGNGPAQLTIIQSGSHPGFEWQVSSAGMTLAYGNGTVYPDMTFKISGTGTPTSAVKTVMASGNLLTVPTSCTPYATSGTTWSATYTDGSSDSNGTAMLTNPNAPAP